SCFVRQALARERADEVTVVDALTYAGNLENLAPVEAHPGYRFARVDVTDAPAVVRLFDAVRPEAVVHFAAESHVDRSIASAAAFVHTNVVGTQVLLDAARNAGVRRFVH